MPLLIALFFRNDLVVLAFDVSPREEWTIFLGWSGYITHLFLLLGAVVVLMNLERTFRAAVGTMRWRIKFMLLGVGVLFAVRLYTSSQALLSYRVDPFIDIIGSGALLIASLLIIRSLFRVGHFELEVYPSQEVLRNSLTVLLVGVYLLIVGVFSKMVTFWGGDVTFPLKALVIMVSLVLLVVLLQSDRFRLQLRHFVGRHLKRPLYDYRKVWLKFSEETSSQLERIELCRSLIRLLADVFQALTVTIWLIGRNEETMTLEGSTSLTDSRSIDSDLSSELVRYFLEHPDPIDLDASKEKWAISLRAANPRQFPDGGNRICIPLIGRGTFLGLIVLGDRIGGEAFSVQGFDTLKCAGSHAASSLLNIQLVQKNLQLKELEAFQTMGAFFVHDLKNAASTLNLMLQNLPSHWDDPEFREDALRGISQTGEKINHMITRLSLVREELKIQVVETDFNEVIQQVLSGWEKRDGVVIKTKLDSLPKVFIDAEQILKVVINLVLNATEALSDGGEIRIETRLHDKWVVLTVKDNGCGISKEFLNNSLFRPFKTTKKNGLGIGMFQSKMIVEAHGGRMMVESEPELGTTFQVRLPV
ncbi:MAG: PEP-CTERM system histidine kinase PrsK [Opitutaceae bacterium]|nr:PEP-CTERM system histidine kinase PrsK [Opitutaceae bacterium]